MSKNNVARLVAYQFDWTADRPFIYVSKAGKLISVMPLTAATHGLCRRDCVIAGFIAGFSAAYHGAEFEEIMKLKTP